MERMALPPPGPGTLPLALLELGCAGNFQVLSGAPGEAERPQPRGTLPQGLPPRAPPLLQHLGRLILGTPEWLPPHQPQQAARRWHRSPAPRSLFALEPSPPGGGLSAQRDPRSGALGGLIEVPLAHVGLSARNSASLRRAPGPPRESLRGTATTCPFWPGGFTPPPEELDPPKVGEGQEEDINFETELLTTPPGLSHGVEFRAPAPGAPLTLCSLLQTLDSFDLGGPNPPEGGPNPPEPPQDALPPRPPSSPPPGPPPRRADSLEELLETEVAADSQDPPAAPPGEEDEDGGPWAVLEDANSPLPNFEELVPDPAFKWPFQLDPFQQRAVLCLERGHSLLVSAHTSAGKTAVAEYALALGLRHGSRTIYTSPIKALSNQKFRDFRETFGDVGLVTGDVTLHPEASCLVMTTEILRSMLYNGSDVLRDLEWLIMDEVHYINDPERGVVWEEVLILLPEHVRLVLLSATLGNALQLAQWVGRTKRRCLRVLITERRPVPLQHFLYPGGRKLFLLLDKDGCFHTQGYYAAVEAKKELSSKHKQSFGAKQPHLGGSNPGQERALWVPLLSLLASEGLLPAVVFSLSRGRCDAQAAAVGGLQLLSPAESRRVRGFLQRCLGRLRGSDRQLPQVLQLSELLEKGLGVHHGGILPLLKEIVELLFSQGLVKVLFATETFAMGVNMPAKTVLFDSIRKHDGNGFRDLLPSEYVQMSGRAGRRGLDATGTVIVVCKGQVPELADLHRVMLGQPPPLQSQFRLSPSLLLNSLRGPGLSLPQLIRSSFREFPRQRLAPAQRRRLRELQQELAKLEGAQEELPPDLPQYYQAVEELRQARATVMRLQAQSLGGIWVLVPGRVLLVWTPQHRNTLGVLLQVTSEGSSKTLSVLLLTEKPPEGGGGTPEDPPRDVPYPEDLLLTRIFLPEGPPWPSLQLLPPEAIVGVTDRTLRLNPPRLLQELRRPPGTPHSPELGSVLQELSRLAGGGCPPLLEPSFGGGSRRFVAPEALEAVAKVKALSCSLGTFSCVHSPRFAQQYWQFSTRQKLQLQLEQLQFELSEQSLTLLPQCQQHLAVLQALGYVSEGGSVALGGRVAAGLSCQPLLMTELLLGNLLSPLQPAEAAALLAPLACPERGDPPPGLPQPLQKALEQLWALADRLGALQQRLGLPEGPEELRAQLGCGLLLPVYEWARGTPLAPLVRGLGVQEGTLVRGIQRLEETLRELARAGRLLGDPGLVAKVEAASARVRRDVVFAASLYTQ